MYNLVQRKRMYYQCLRRVSIKVWVVHHDVCSVAIQAYPLYRTVPYIVPMWPILLFWSGLKTLNVVTFLWCVYTASGLTPQVISSKQPKLVLTLMYCLEKFPPKSVNLPWYNGSWCLDGPSSQARAVSHANLIPFTKHRNWLSWKGN